MNEIIEETKIENMIYEIRGKQVMLDSDLARLYGCKNGTKSINLAVKRNMDRFPNNFYFQLTVEEYNNLWFQNETAINNKSRITPYAFTEQGIAMLSSVLRTDVAAKVSIKIMNAFVEMRKYVTNSIEQKYINNLVLKDNKRIDILEETFSNFKEKNNHIFYEGQIYDAYSLLVDILNKAEKEIIIIDNYVDKTILDITCLLDKNITIITNKYNNIDYEKYQKQYKNLKIVINNKFHDRFIILDKKILYHSGASFKDLGNKCFALNKIEDENILKELLEKMR